MRRRESTDPKIWSPSKRPKPCLLSCPRAFCPEGQPQHSSPHRHPKEQSSWTESVRFSQRTERSNNDAGLEQRPNHRKLGWNARDEVLEQLRPRGELFGRRE